MNNNKINKKKLCIIVICILFMFTLSFFLLYSSLDFNTSSNIKYSKTGNINYYVNLKENDFYTEKKLEKGKQYISTLIDSIDTIFNYKFSIDKSMDYIYNYEITATINITGDTNNTSIYTKKEDIYVSKDVKLNKSKGFFIDKNLKVDYTKYNDIAKKFKKQYAIISDSNLIIEMNVNIKDKDGYEIKNINGNNKLTLTIPLTEQTINITSNKINLSKNEIIKTNDHVKIANIIIFVISIVLLFISFIIFLILIITIINSSRKKSLYIKTLSKILKDYDRLIVEADNINLNPDTNIINVKSFNEILDARDNLEKPIVFVEVYKGCSVFVVNNDYEAYKYVLDERKMKKNN